MSAVLEREKSDTLEDLVDRLGGIPLSRIRRWPAPGTAIEQDVIDIHDHENRLYELVDGVLVEKGMGFQESRIAAVIIHALEEFLQKTGLGIVVGEAGMMRLTSGLVRIPDVSIVLWERMPSRRIPKEPIPSLAPDLAVEVLSSSNTPAEIRRKLSEYFTAGCRCAWIVDPVKRLARVYDTPTKYATLTGDGVVTAEAVAPGFRISVTEIFQRAGVD